MSNFFYVSIFIGIIVNIFATLIFYEIYMKKNAQMSPFVNGLAVSAVTWLVIGVVIYIWALFGNFEGGEGAMAGVAILFFILYPLSSVIFFCRRIIIETTLQIAL